MPWRIRRQLQIWSRHIWTYNNFDRIKAHPADDRTKPLLVPEGEEFAHGGIWVTEFFPPSMYSQLQESVRRNGWESDYYGFGESTKGEQIRRARQGRGFAWARIATVTSPEANFVGVGLRQPIPVEFSLIDVSVRQIGRSLTAVVAFVRLSDVGRTQVDSVWKQEHEPKLVRYQTGPSVEGRYFAALISTQSERERMHDLARKWLSENCAGYFAASDLGQPVVDYGLFSKFDPISEVSRQGNGDPLRMLGLESVSFGHYLSPQVPGVAFEPGHPLRVSLSERLRNSWGLVGNLSKVREANRDQVGYGEHPFSVDTLAGMSDDAVRAFLLRVAAFRYVRSLGEVLGESRDSARSKHLKFSPKSMEALRGEMLLNSLDIPVVARDVQSLVDGSDWWPEGIVVSAEIDDPEGGVKTINLIDNMGKEVSHQLELLQAEDAAYRDVLASAASLGASASQGRQSRYALALAGLSLIVALATLAVATGDPALWEVLRDTILGG
ncbi:hypothetical protein [Janibacter limosus]|uniref:hypothetical protein n=1 Tax=Janibacter limosus TaxID=53458 RepID=UPI0012EE12DB|nr:hypothetical protein [Janibacter limosus]